MRMEENLNKGDALRVNGAFAVPSILIAKGNVELSEDADMTAKFFLEKINDEINSFLKKMM